MKPLLNCEISDVSSVTTSGPTQWIYLQQTASGGWKLVYSSGLFKTKFLEKKLLGRVLNILIGD